jgi:hypothetical protein
MKSILSVRREYVCSLQPPPITVTSKTTSDDFGSHDGKPSHCSLFSAAGPPRSAAPYRNDLTRIAIVAIALALALSACAQTPVGRGTTITTASGASSAAVDDFIPSLFTATSAEYNSAAGQEWIRFEATIVAVETNNCIEDAGFTQPQLLDHTPSGIPFNNNEWPDIAQLEAGNWGTPRPSTAPMTSPTVGMSPSEAAAYESDLSACEHRAESVFLPVSAELQALEGLWTQAVTPVYADPRVTQAWAGWGKCVAAAGFSVTDDQAYFALANAAEATDPAQYARLAEVYGHCVAPVSAILDELRLQVRDRFLDQHALQVQQLGRDLTDLAARLSTRYSISPTAS